MNVYGKSNTTGIAKWPQGALPCLPLSDIHRLPCRGRHRYARFEGCRTLSEWSYRPCGRGRKWASFSQWSMDSVQLLRKRTRLTFWWQPGKCAASVVWGVVRNAPGGMYDLSPLLLWSKEKLCFWAVSPCLRNTQLLPCIKKTWRKGLCQYRYIDIRQYRCIYINIRI